MKVVAIVQARMGSSRLPGKVMMNLDGENPALYYVIKQLQSCKLLDEMVVATSTKPNDDKIFDFTRTMNVQCFRGSEENVLDRYYQCAKKTNADIIIRIPADKPLIDPNLVDDIISKFDTSKFDYISNWLTKNVPSGTEVEAMTFVALEKAWNEAIGDENKEHVTPYIYNNPKEFRIFSVEYNEFPLDLRYALDTKEDYEFIKLLISKINVRPIHIEDIIKIVNKLKNKFI
jgi:spore coat polysaccharide biosynthesis protein SpsF